MYLLNCTISIDFHAIDLRRKNNRLIFSIFRPSLFLKRFFQSKQLNRIVKHFCIHINPIIMIMSKIASTGKLQSYTVAHLETTANKALEDMEKAGELSGYQASVDPEQDVLATSTVEVVIKNVPVGVIRKIKVKIGYVKSL